MSGHSHFSSIKHKKEITDAKRGKIFSKMAKLISIAAREGGNPLNNFKLKQAIEEARSFNMPKENIERAIKKGTGELKGAKLEQITFEAYGPEGIAIIIEGITDNKNRTLGEVKQILNQHGGKLASEGSVKWLFERKGAIIVNIKNQISNIKNAELELLTIEAGAEDIYWRNAAPEGDESRQRRDTLDIYTKPEDLEKVKKSLEGKEIKIETSSLDWVAKEMVEIKDKKTCQKLFEALDENDAVQDIYSNLKVL